MVLPNEYLNEKGEYDRNKNLKLLIIDIINLNCFLFISIIDLFYR